MNEFLDSSVLIPPGKIDDKSLFTPENLPLLRRAAADTKASMKQRASIKLQPITGNRNRFQGYVKLKSWIDDSEIRSSIKSEKDEREKIDYTGTSDGETVHDRFSRTGRPFGGVLHEILHRLPFYCNDFVSALNFQCVTSVLFIFFANFAVAVAMGEVLGNIILKFSHKLKLYWLQFYSQENRRRPGCQRGSGFIDD